MQNLVDRLCFFAGKMQKSLFFGIADTAHNRCFPYLFQMFVDDQIRVLSSEVILQETIIRFVKVKADHPLPTVT